MKTVISQELKDKMSKEMILANDIIAVLNHVNETGNYIIDADTGYCIAHAKVGFITCWVIYEHKNDDYIIHNVYSHRIEIQDEM